MSIKITTDDNRAINEVFAKHEQFAVHLERMDDDRFCLIIDTANQQAILNISSDCNVSVTLQELVPKDSPDGK